MRMTVEDGCASGSGGPGQCYVIIEWIGAESQPIYRATHRPLEPVKPAARAEPSRPEQEPSVPSAGQGHPFTRTMLALWARVTGSRVHTGPGRCWLPAVPAR